MPGIKPPQELYTPGTIATLSGASAMVVITTSVFQDIFGLSPQWLKIVGLVVSEALAFLGAVLVPKRNRLVFIVAFFNGLLIYATASGLNAINNSAGATNAKQALVVPFVDSVAWWPPVELAELQTAAGETAATIGKVTGPMRRASTVLKDISVPLREERVGLEKRLSDLEASVAAQPREAERPVHPAEREYVERRRAEKRAYLERRPDELERIKREVARKVQEVARLATLIPQVQQEVRGFANSGAGLDDAQKELEGVVEALRAALASANRVTGLER